MKALQLANLPLAQAARQKALQALVPTAARHHRLARLQVQAARLQELHLQVLANVARLQVAADHQDHLHLVVLHLAALRQVVTAVNSKSHTYEKNIYIISGIAMCRSV